MKILYYPEITKVNFISDFDLEPYKDSGQAFLMQLEEIEGVENVMAFRYHFEVSVGFMFNTNTVVKEIVKLLQDTFNPEEIRKAVADDLVSKITEFNEGNDLEDTNAKAESLRNLQLLLNNDSPEA